MSEATQDVHLHGPQKVIGVSSTPSEPPRAL
jgi:hypothetical protein